MQGSIEMLFYYRIGKYKFCACWQCLYSTLEWYFRNFCSVEMFSVLKRLFTRIFRTFLWYTVEKCTIRMLTTSFNFIIISRWDLKNYFKIRTHLYSKVWKVVFFTEKETLNHNLFPTTFGIIWTSFSFRYTSINRNGI